jgi:hypothetical protein
MRVMLGKRLLILPDGVPVDPSRMTEHRAFIDKGLKAAEAEVADAVAMANLHLKPDTITKSLRQRCMARYRQVAVIVRRLIFLLALSIQLAPARPRAQRQAASQPGVEDVTASFGPQLGAFKLAPAKITPRPESFAAAAGKKPAGPVTAGPLIVRICLLLKVIREPDAHARRLAFTLRRWRTRGESKPFIGPSAGQHKLRAELGLVAGLLPKLLGTAMEDWTNTS